jgi:DNA-binding response OmpR family regulator
MEYRINQIDKSVEHNGELIFLPKKEFKLLEYLQSNKGRVFSREDLIREVWEYDTVFVDTRTVDVHIRRLRKTFPKIPIVTRKCYGYMWNNNVVQNPQNV